MTRMTEGIDIRSADGARARLRRQGAHLTHWCPAGQSDNALFLSERAVYAPGVAIRGGVPVIFPQFADEGDLPKHGFARTQDWALLAHGQAADGSGFARLQLVDNAQTRALWPQRFQTELSLRIQGAQLQMRLDVLNRGDNALCFTAALHTYLRVPDIAEARIEGLQHCRYRDSADSRAERIESDAARTIRGEFDRIYWQTPPQLSVRAPPFTYELEQQGFADTVIWNPGAARAAELPDLHADDWRQLLCVEAAAVGQPVLLPPQQRWSGAQTIVLSR